MGYLNKKGHSSIVFFFKKRQQSPLDHYNRFLRRTRKRASQSLIVICQCDGQNLVITFASLKQLKISIQNVKVIITDGTEETLLLVKKSDRKWSF